MSEERYSARGTVTRGVGGLYRVMLDGGDTPLAGASFLLRARGNLRDSDGLLAGDRVRVLYTDSSFTLADGRTVPADDTAGLPGAVIEGILPRKNRLIRPAMANLELLFAVCASARPEPDTTAVDKLLAAAEYSGADAAVIIGKSELCPERASELKNIYEHAGYRAFAVSCVTGEGIGELRSYAESVMSGRLSAFSGASGVGKSTLLGRLFPELSLQAGEIGKKGRGKHTTRTLEIFSVDCGGSALIADTPGFSLIDFENFDFLPLEALEDSMREFGDFRGKCRYADCSHTKETECEIVRAVADGRIAASRHKSYCEMYASLKNKHSWDTK